MKFDEKELEIIGEYNMPGIYGAPDSIVPKYNRPITPKENMLRMLEGKMPGFPTRPWTTMPYSPCNARC